MLSVSSGSSVNYVNANFIAKEKGIELSTKALTNSSGYKNKVTIKITTSKGVKIYLELYLVKMFKELLILMDSKLMLIQKVK